MSGCLLSTVTKVLILDKIIYQIALEIFVILNTTRFLLTFSNIQVDKQS